MKKPNKENLVKNVLLVGGGTGGHVVPVYNLYVYLRESAPEIDVKIVGGGTEIENHFFAGLSDYFVIKSGKFQRYKIFENLWQLLLLLYGLCQSLLLLLKLRPQVIFCKGGFVALPIVFWAKILKIPYFVHESDAVMGKTNRYATTHAKKVFTGFPLSSYKFKKRKNVKFVGQVIQPEFDSDVEFDFGFDRHKPTILVTGGSLGALNLNRHIYNSLERLLPDFNIIHQTGARSFQEGIDARAKLPENMTKSYFVTDFLSVNKFVNQMISALKKADLVISRAGATTIAEIAHFDKPMILIPYPYASEDHQFKNGQILKKQKACEVIIEKELNRESLIAVVEKLFADKKRMKEMARLAKDFFPNDAIKTIGQEIIDEIG